jgi:hypothetical protein
MRRTLQILGLLLALGAVLFWLANGANRGWTKTSVPVKAVDAVTGIENVEYHPGFVPGVDFLGALLLGAILLEAVSFLFRNRTNT